MAAEEPTTRRTVTLAQGDSVLVDGAWITVQRLTARRATLRIEAPRDVVIGAVRHAGAIDNQDTGSPE